MNSTTALLQPHKAIPPGNPGIPGEEQMLSELNLNAQECSQGHHKFCVTQGARTFLLVLAFLSHGCLLPPFLALSRDIPPWGVFS